MCRSGKFESIISPRKVLRTNNAVLRQIVDYDRYFFLQRHPVGLQMQFRILRRFIGIVDASKILDFPSSSLFV